MKQFKPTLLFAFMLCVLIGYFEPANAAKSLVAAGDPAYVALNSTTSSCPFWPNPISPASTLTAIGTADVTSISLTGGDGKVYPGSVVETNQWFPVDVVETNQWFPVDIIKSLTGTLLSLPAVPDGGYIVTLKTTGGYVYFTKVNISSK